MISEVTRDVIILQHMAIKYCVGPRSIQTHIGDCSPGQSRSNATSQSGLRCIKNLRRVRWFKPPVHANCSASMRTPRWNFFCEITSNASKKKEIADARRSAAEPKNPQEDQSSHTNSYHPTGTPLGARHSCPSSMREQPQNFRWNVCPSHDACKCACLSSTRRNMAPSHERSGKKLQFCPSFEHAR